MPRTVLILATSLLLSAPDLAAQAGRGHNVWAGLSGEVAMTSRVAVIEELWLGRADWGRTWQMRQAAQGLSVALTPRWRVAMGHGYLHLARPRAAAHEEGQLWAHAATTFATGPLRWSHRSRAEWRWIHAMPAWHRSARWRGQLRATLPLGARARAFGSGEAFVRLHPAAERGTLEQLRLHGGIGRDLSDVVGLELGYVEQRLRRGATRERAGAIAVHVRARWRRRAAVPARSRT